MTKKLLTGMHAMWGYRRLIRSQISMWIFNVQFEITWLMQSRNFTNLISKEHERDSLSTYTFTEPEPISLISLQEWFFLWNVNAQAYFIGCHPFEQTLHHIIPDNQLLHTQCPSNFAKPWQWWVAGFNIVKIKSFLLLIHRPQFRSSQYW
jgi:hypothetical protein